jgi:hypothetical protein
MKTARFLEPVKNIIFTGSNPLKINFLSIYPSNPLKSWYKNETHTVLAFRDADWGMQFNTKKTKQNLKT